MPNIPITNYPVAWSNPTIFRVSAALPAAGAWDAAPTEFSVAGADSLNLALTYTRGAAGGAFDFQVVASPYSVAALVPAGATEWMPLAVYEPYASVTAAAEVIFKVPLDLTGIERLRIRARETGVVGTPGTLSIVGTLVAGGVAGDALSASENLIGLVGSPDIVVTVTPTVDAGNAYASGDLLFDSTAIANAVRVAGGTALLESITIVDKADQGAALTLLIANAATDFGTLNAAPDPDDAECATVIGWIPVATADYVDLGASKVACIRNLGLMVKAAAGATSLYVAGMNGTGTPTYGASELVLVFGFLRS